MALATTPCQESAEREGKPALPEYLRLYITECAKKTKAPATVRRYLAMIVGAHLATGFIKFPRQ